jgi:predicted ArsR family transcriptional regulator
MHKPKRRPICHALDLLLELSSVHFGLSIRELAKRLDVSERMIYRYLEHLEAAGVTLDRRRGTLAHGWERVIRLRDIRRCRLVPYQ